VPLFMSGTVAIAAGTILLNPWLALGGPLAMAIAVGAQGRTHRRESTAPVPFEGPVDVVGRLFVEQWINFPRYVLSGELGRAWRKGALDHGA
jgi:hypothetical protein